MLIKKILPLVIIVFFNLIANGAWAALPNGFSGIYAFGDSLSDVGNYVAQNPSCKDSSAPVTNKTGGATPGKMWIDFLANSYGLPVSKGSLQNSGGTAWAIAGNSTLGVVQQVQQYLATNQVNPNALYVMWVGANDVLERVFINKENYVQVILHGTFSVGFAVELLYNAGARNFLVVGLPDISLTPLASNPSNNLFPYREQVQQLSAGWNTTLFEKNYSSGKGPLAQLLKRYSDIKIYTWDVFAALTLVVNNPSAFGFPNQINGMANNQALWCGDNEAQNPDQFIFYDLIHTSSHTHQLIAQLMRNDATQFTL